jgi:predicted deacylase
VSEGRLFACFEVLGVRAGPHVLITAGVHGDELEPMAAVRRLMAELAPYSIRGKVSLIPVVNTDAFRLGRRTGGDDLDLARTCPGRADGSTTQRVAFELSAVICSADFYVDLHTGGVRLRVHPLAGYTLHPERAVLEAQRRMARAFNLPIVWGTDHRLEGRTLSVARDAGVPAIYAEYGGGARLDRNAVEALVQGCLNVRAELGMIDRAAPPSRVAHFVEDPREGAGHIQIAYPAPVSGFFESEVEVGQRVAIGDRLGTICDDVGRRREAIVSRHDGLVLVLHEFASVQEGDGLAVVLDA